MITAYVKHYLTPEGIHYFQEDWFSRFNEAVKQQPGFVSIAYTLNSQEKDCIDVVLKFQNETTLDAWAEQPLHDQFVVELDACRSRDYWEAVLTEDEQADPATLNWTIIKN